MSDDWDEPSHQGSRGGGYDGRSQGGRNYSRGGGGNSYNRDGGNSYNRSGGGGGGNSYNRREGGGGGGGNSYNRGEGGAASNNWRDNNANSTEIEVPSKYIGRIIGKGGSKISDLQYDSGAKINVTKDTVGENTIVKISGSDAEIRKAQALIEELAQERTFRR